MHSNLWRRGWSESVWASEFAWPHPSPEEDHRKGRRRKSSIRLNHAPFWNLKTQTDSVYTQKQCWPSEKLTKCACDGWLTDITNVSYLVLCCQDKRPENLQQTSQWTEEQSGSDPVLQDLGTQNWCVGSASKTWSTFTHTYKHTSTLIPPVHTHTHKIHSLYSPTPPITSEYLESAAFGRCHL